MTHIASHLYVYNILAGYDPLPAGLCLGITDLHIFLVLPRNKVESAEYENGFTCSATYSYPK